MTVGEVTKFILGQLDASGRREKEKNPNPKTHPKQLGVNIY